MSRDVRCPVCNGTGSVPLETVNRIERDRDRVAVLLHKVSVLWGEICNLAVDAKKKNATLEGIRGRVRSAYIISGKNLTLEERVGTRSDATPAPAT